jgi:hypothetical protein
MRYAVREAMIDFTRAFDSAWERMMVILFRPFDFGKWLVIGLSAFLAGFLQGGNGFSGGSFNNNFNDLKNQSDSSTSDFNLHQLHANLIHALASVQVWLIIAFVIFIMVIVFAFALVLYWLGARGQFLFLDNIVRNRGAVSWPWQYYSRLANSLFGFYLLFMVVSCVVIVPFIAVGVVMGIPLYQHHRWPVGGEIAGFVVLGCLYVAVALLLGVALFIFREFGVPLMFRNGLLARPAFIESMKLIQRYPGSVTIFILLRIALAIAVIIVSVVACCFCCIGVIPYVGTVAILPALIYVRCFTLDCLAQFGPEYDVWTVDVPSSATTVTPPLPPG